MATDNAEIYRFNLAGVYISRQIVVAARTVETRPKNDTRSISKIDLTDDALDTYRTQKLFSVDPLNPVESLLEAIRWIYTCGFDPLCLGVATYGPLEKRPKGDGTPKYVSISPVSRRVCPYARVVLDSVAGVVPVSETYSNKAHIIQLSYLSFAIGFCSRGHSQH